MFDMVDYGFPFLYIVLYISLAFEVRPSMRRSR